MNFGNFMAAMAKILPAVGETVIALHPGNVAESIKIQLGTQLVTAVTAALHESATGAASSVPAPAGTPEPPGERLLT